jgi:hypothetical protein
VENGYTIQQPNDLTSDDKANLQLDAQAKDIICCGLSKDIFRRFQMLGTAKQIWDAIKNVHEEFVARTDPHTQMLRAMFTGFRSLRKESAMELTDRLTNIVERLHQRGVTDITDRDVVNKLLSALDATFDPIVAEIKQRPDYEELHYVEVMTLLSLHEEKMELENADQESSSESEGEILSHYGSEQEEEDVENQHSITRELEMLTERLRDLRRQNLRLTNDDNVDLFGSSRKLPPKEIKCFKCKQFGHYIAECPSWEDEKPSNRWKYLHCNGFTRIDRHTKLSKKNEFSSSSSKRSVTDVKAKAAIDSNLKKISQLNRVRHCFSGHMETRRWKKQLLQLFRTLRTAIVKNAMVTTDTKNV